MFRKAVRINTMYNHGITGKVKQAFLFFAGAPRYKIMVIYDDRSGKDDAVIQDFRVSDSVDGNDVAKYVLRAARVNWSVSPFQEIWRWADRVEVVAVARTREHTTIKSINIV